MGASIHSLSVVVPAYNEEKTIITVLSALLENINDLDEVIVVDDGSKDRTADLVEAFIRDHSKIRLIRQPKNSGKTEALKTGFAASTGDIVIIQDADLEYDPAEISSIVEPIRLGKADVVYGSRFMVRKASRILYFRHYLANRMLTFLSNILTDCNFSDVETCYKAFRGEIIRNMIITSKGFGFEIEVTAKVAKLKCRIYEVPISYYGRTYEEGKKIGLKDGIHALGYIIRYNLFNSLESSYTRKPEL